MTRNEDLNPDDDFDLNPNDSFDLNPDDTAILNPEETYEETVERLKELWGWRCWAESEEFWVYYPMTHHGNDGPARHNEKCGPIEVDDE